jgi:hypothetical protein
MKTLRLLRNIAALFIFGAALLVSPHGAARANIIGPWPGCRLTACKPGHACNNTGCYETGQGGFCTQYLAGYNCQQMP